MRVLYFSRDYTPHDHRFLSVMVSAGLETHFLRLERRSRQTEDRALPEGVALLTWEGGTQRPFRWTDLPSRVLELRRAIRAIEPDVIHAGPLHTCAYIAALARAGTEPPLVSMSWGSDLLVDARKNGWMRNITRFILRRSDWLLGDCAAVRSAAVEFGFPAERVTLFPWGVDLQRFQPKNRREGIPPYQDPTVGAEPDTLDASIRQVSLPAGADPDAQDRSETFPPYSNPAGPDLRERLGWQDAFVILSLRSWEAIYGVDLVVRGFARAAAGEPRLRLILLSSGSLAPQIQGLLSQLGMHDRVYLGGQVSQNALPRFYHAADLYLSASHSDGSSISLLEALACGLPALVSDIAGNREWIEHGVQGWLFPDGDVEALAQGLLTAGREAEKLLEMRRAARQTAEERADWSKNVEKLIETYQKVTA